LFGCLKGEEGMNLFGCLKGGRGNEFVRMSEGGRGNEFVRMSEGGRGVNIQLLHGDIWMFKKAQSHNTRLLLG
jgi:hypothetical protein